MKQNKEKAKNTVFDFFVIFVISDAYTEIITQRLSNGR